MCVPLFRDKCFRVIYEKRYRKFLTTVLFDPPRLAPHSFTDTGTASVNNDLFNSFVEKQTFIQKTFRRWAWWPGLQSQHSGGSQFEASLDYIATYCFKKTRTSWALVAHIYNPSYLGG
jgi:hypothetical protein